MQIFYFTGTGNSLYIAKSVGGEIHSIPRLLREGKREFSDDTIGFVFPCYFSGLPRMVMDFILQSKFQADYYFAVMTYGSYAGSGLRHMEEIGQKVGIQFNYTNEILMIDNYLPMFDIQVQLQKEMKKNIEGSFRKIIQDIQARKSLLTRKGMASSILSRMTHSVYNFKMIDSGDKKFIRMGVKPLRLQASGCKPIRSLTLALNVLLDCLFADVFYTACKISVRPKCLFLPEMFRQM